VHHYKDQFTDREKIEHGARTLLGLRYQLRYAGRSWHWRLEIDHGSQWRSRNTHFMIADLGIVGDAAGILLHVIKVLGRRDETS